VAKGERQGEGSKNTHPFGREKKPQRVISLEYTITKQRLKIQGKEE
jgi:hypothetical protein